MVRQSYWLFGLQVRSELALPGLEHAPDINDADASIELGQVPAPADPLLELVVDELGATLTIEGVGRYRIERGTRITIEPEAGAPEANVRLFLLGSAMGVLLHQRGLLPLHASAVEVDGKAVAFAGPSGSGKSTLAAAFHDHGYRVIADDVCVVRFDQAGRALACHGIPRLRLWEEALVATGREAGNYELSYAGDESFRKFDVPIPPEVNRRAGMPLAAVLLLSEGQSLAFRRVLGSAAMDAVFANTYRGEYVQRAGRPSTHWEGVIRLIGVAPILEFVRPRDLQNLAEQVRMIANFIRQGETKVG